MKINEIVNNKFTNIDDFAEKEKKNYINAEPFPNIVIEDFFNENFLSKIISEFPDLSKKNNSQVYKNKNDVKFANNNYTEFTKNIKIFFDFLNSDFFLTFLNKITNIKEKLISDPELNGGGLHEIKRG